MGLAPDAEFWSASDSAWTARRICAGENLAADKALADRMDGNSLRTQIEGIKNLLETARVDVKNTGTAENDVRIEVLNDAKCQMNKPAWFSKDRRGYGSVITRSSQHIKWKVTCVQDGNLLIRLMGIDWRDASGTRVPLWVDYTYFAVDGKAIFTKTIPACHDKHYDFYKEVRDGDVLDVEICWKPHVYSGDGMLRILYSKFSVDAKNGMNPQPRPDIPSNVVPELHWAQVYHDTIANSEWILDKSVSPGGVRGWAVGYNFLYALYRILDEMRPQHILELGLGQSTKLTGQYAGYFDAVHTVVEHDQEWVDFFCHGWKKLSQQMQICISPLVEREFDGQKYFAYQEFDKIMESQNTTYELVLVDGSFGGRSERSRRDIIAYLPELLSKEFVIMVDDCGRKGEINLLREIEDILGRNKIEYASGLYRSGGNCHVGVLVCKKWKFFTTM